MNLTGGEAVMPSYPSHQAPHHGGGGHPSHPGQQQQQQQQGQQQDEIEKVVNALLPKVLRKLEKACCVVM